MKRTSSNIPSFRQSVHTSLLFRRALFVLACSMGAMALCPASARAEDADSSLPNVVLILADDMGYGDPHVLNQESSLPTPSIDQFASEGMVFTDAHSPSAVCTPTRYGLLTGQYCWRTRLRSKVLSGRSEALIDQERMTLASMLKTKGYQTGIVGKWHLGLGFSLLPDVQTPQDKHDCSNLDFSQPLSDGPGDHGFDYSYILPASLDMPPYIYIENHTLTEFPTLTQSHRGFPRSIRQGPRSSDFIFEDCLDHFLGKANGFIEQNAQADSPFFLYFPLTAPHKPVMPHERFQGTSELGAYGDFITQIDWTLGQVFAKLEEVGVAENTIVIVTSDNGSFMRCVEAPDASGHVDSPSRQEFRADRHRANGPWRGTKADIWEAGHRVPFFVRWPGHIEPQSTCDTTVCHTDILATLAAAIDIDIEGESGLDSFSMLPLWLGDLPDSPREPVIHHSSQGMFAIRSGDWKLILGNGSGGRARPVGGPFRRPYQLFNLAEDRAEQNNLIEEHPEIAERLTAEFEAIRNDE